MCALVKWTENAWNISVLHNVVSSFVKNLAYLTQVSSQAGAAKNVDLVGTSSPMGNDRNEF